MGAYPCFSWFRAIVDGTQRAYASDFVKPELRGIAHGVFYTMIRIAAVAGLNKRYQDAMIC